MRITDLLDKRSISLDGDPKNKQEALDMAIDLMKGSDKINDQEAYRKQVYKREAPGSAGEDCAGTSVSVIWHSDHWVSYELRYRACHGSN